MSFFQGRYQSCFESIAINSITVPKISNENADSTSEFIHIGSINSENQPSILKSLLVKRIAELSLMPKISTELQAPPSDFPEILSFSFQSTQSSPKPAEKFSHFTATKFNPDSSSFVSLLASVEQDLGLLRDYCLESIKNRQLSQLQDSKTPDLDLAVPIPDSEELYQNAILSHLSLLLVARATSILNAYTCQILADSAEHAEEEQRFWKSQVSSDTRVLYHIIQTLPSKFISMAFKASESLIEIVKSVLKKAITTHPNLSSESSLKDVLDILIASIHKFSTMTFQKLKSIASIEFLKSSFVFGYDFNSKHISIQKLLKSNMEKIMSENLGIVRLTAQKINFTIFSLGSFVNSAHFRLGALSDFDFYYSNYSQQNPNLTNFNPVDIAPFYSIQSAQMFYKIDSAIHCLNQVTDLGLDSHDFANKYSNSEKAQFWENRILATVDQLSHIKLKIHNFNHFLTEDIAKNKRPNFLTRAWIPTLAVGYSSFYFSKFVIGNADSIVSYFYQCSDIIVNYVSRYILSPLKDAYNTIRYGTPILSVVATDSLRSSAESLKLMSLNVLSSLQQLDQPQIDRISYEIDNGDISSIMEKYAKEIQHPIWNSLFGPLIPLILIQAQKANVDIQQALAALDKLLKSNELNFVFVSVAPAVFFLYLSSLASLNALKKYSGDIKMLRADIEAKLVMRNIDYLLNKQLIPISNQDTTDFEQKIETEQNSNRLSNLGLLLCHSKKLRRAMFSVLNSRRNGFLGLSLFSSSVFVFGGSIDKESMDLMLISDISELENHNFSILQKRNVLERMYRTYELN
ncbi:hypothetical protein BB560_002615 [Smittium megazygosporum]|uniref:Nuclear control of ATPase protein 2 n=1 Tax=Smittium megazygosporum TaxID=133381 RepID=A0A2T9ZEB3_9FUNG|nr:hypothetical protein BB560_002615 [Smittium megazygosporum]